MAPAWLQPLLWVYCRCGPVPENLGGLGWKGDLLRWGFIVPDNDRNGSGFDVTPKARAFLDAVFAVPHPVARWVIPTPPLQVGNSAQAETSPAQPEKEGAQS